MIVAIPQSIICRDNARRTSAAWDAVCRAIDALRAARWTAVADRVERAIERDGLLGAQRELADHTSYYDRPAIAEASRACDAIFFASPASHGVREIA